MYRLVQMRTTKRFFTVIFFLLAGIGSMAAGPVTRIWPKKKKTVQDTAVSVVKSRDFNMKETGKMLTSTYPVRIQVAMNAVEVHSDHNQILPIYTRSGAFYMAARINKGINWINGLPRGHYFINNRPITIK